VADFRFIADKAIQACRHRRAAARKAVSLPEEREGKAGTKEDNRKGKVLK
jgi:hypothetical protein